MVEGAVPGLRPVPGAGPPHIVPSLWGHNLAHLPLEKYLAAALVEELEDTGRLRRVCTVASDSEVSAPIDRKICLGEKIPHLMGSWALLPVPVFWGTGGVF